MYEECLYVTRCESCANFYRTVDIQTDMYHIWPVQFEAEIVRFDSYMPESEIPLGQEVVERDVLLHHTVHIVCVLGGRVVLVVVSGMRISLAGEREPEP
jgi:hypothetical protein